MEESGLGNKDADKLKGINSGKRIKCYGNYFGPIN